MVEDKAVKDQSEEIITSTVLCVNTHIMYVYELLHGNIINQKKILVEP